MGSHVLHVLVHGVPGLVPRDHQAGEVLVEHITDDPDGQIRFTVEQSGRARRLRLALDGVPLLRQARDVAFQLLLARPLRGSAHDHARTRRHDLLEDLLQARTLFVGELTADTGHRPARHIHQVTARQADLTGQAGTFVSHRVFGDLHQDRLAGLEHRFDAFGLAVHPQHVPVDLTRVQDGVASLADVDERGLHRRQHVLYPTQVHIAHERTVRGAIDVVLDKDVVLEHGDLCTIPRAPDDQVTFDRLPASQEFRLGHYRCPATPLLATLAAALLLGFQPGGTTHRLDLVLDGFVLARFAHPDHGVRRIVLDGLGGASHTATAPTTTPAAAFLLLRRALGAVTAFAAFLPRLGGPAVLGGLGGSGVLGGLFRRA